MVAGWLLFGVLEELAAAAVPCRSERHLSATRETRSQGHVTGREVT